MSNTTNQDDLEQAMGELAALQESTIRAQAEAGAAQTLYQLKKAAAFEPQREQQAAERERRNRTAWPEICKTLGLSNIEANYRILVDLTEELSVWAVQQVIQSNAASLVPASELEIAAFELEEKQSLARFISEAHSPLLTPTQKAQISAREVEERNAAAIQRQQVEYAKIIDQPLEYLRERTAEIQQKRQWSRLSTTELRERITETRQQHTAPQYPPIPEEITFSQIKRMDRSQLRELLQNYGKEQVDARCGYQKPKQGGLVRNINEKAFLGLQR